MHSAPAVRYPVALARPLVRAVSVLWLVAAALGGWWWYATGAAGWRLAAGGACLLLIGAAAAFLLHSMPVGSLRWDGQAWWWRTDEAEIQVTLSLHFDFQHLMVLRAAGLPGRDPWCCVERAALPRAWNDLRCAVYASPRVERVPTADGGIAS